MSQTELFDVVILGSGQGGKRLAWDLGRSGRKVAVVERQSPPMIGSEAGEVMAAIQAAMLAGLPYQKLRDAVFAHLTIAEGIGLLFERLEARST